MIDEGAIAILLVGVLAYKSLELIIIRDKVAQAFTRGNRLPTSSPARSCFWARVVNSLEQEFVTVGCLYFLSTMTLLGVLLIFEADRVTKGSYLQAQVISAVTVLASIFSAFLNIAVERFRTHIERG